MKLKLIKLTEKYKEALCEMIDEWREDQIKNNTDRSPGVIFKNDPRNFDYYADHLDLKEETGRYVPGSVFFLLDEERDRLLGAAHIRHYLNEGLRHSGGHIGDGIRPTERGRGYGNEIVRLALDECCKLGIDRVLMTCDKDNVASAKTIIRNGGVLENYVVNEDGEVEQRDWISL